MTEQELADDAIEYEEEYEEEEEGLEDEAESPRETVARILAEQRKSESEASDDDSGGEGEPQEQKAQEPAQKPAEEVKEEAQPEEAVVPPARFSAKEKELFNKLPQQLKPALMRMVKDHEGKLTRTLQEAQAAKREYEHIGQAVRPYLMQNPHLMEQGYTESRLVAELIGAHVALTNPETAIPTFVKLGHQIGIDDNILQQIAEGGPRQSAGITGDPNYQALQQELNQLKSYQQQSQERERNQVVSQIASEMREVQNMTDAQGNYVYPHLHDAAFVERLKPLVSELVKSEQGLSYGDALKRAYIAATGTFPQPAQETSFPAQKQANGRAQAAAVSVRGKSAPRTPGTEQEIPPEALGSAQDSARWALNQLRRGQ